MVRPTRTRAAAAVRLGLLALGAAGMVAMAATAGAATFYASTGGEIWQIDVPTGVGTFVGDTGYPQITDLAASPSGELYGTTGAELVLIDPATAATTLVGPHGAIPGLMVGLDFAADGTLYGVTQSAGALVTISTADGSATASIVLGYSSIGDVAVAEDCTLYGSFLPGLVVRLSPVVGGLREIGSSPRMSGLDFEPASGWLYGFLGGSDQLAIIDTQTAAVYTAGLGAAPIRVFGATFFEPFGCRCDADPAGPEPVGNSLRAVRDDADVYLSWAASFDAVEYSLRRDPVKTALGMTEISWRPYTTAVDLGHAYAPPALSLYQVFAIDCAGTPSVE